VTSPRAGVAAGVCQSTPKAGAPIPDDLAAGGGTARDKPAGRPHT